MNQLIISIYDDSIWSFKIKEGKNEALISWEDHISWLYPKELRELVQLLEENKLDGTFFEKNFLDYQIIIIKNEYIDEWINIKRGVL